MEPNKAYHWLEIILGKNTSSFRRNTFVCIVALTFAHIIGAFLTNGLPRLLKDAGFLFAMAGDFLILLAVQFYITKLREIPNALRVITKNYRDETVSNIQTKVLHWKYNLLFGFLSVALTITVQWWFGYPPWSVTMFEDPYFGPVRFSIRYTSAIMVAVSSIGWWFIALVAGSIFWMSISTVYAMRAITRQFRPAINFSKIEEERGSLKAISKVAFYATLMPAVGVSYTPIAVSSAFFDYTNLAGFYMRGIMLYIAFVSWVFFKSMWYFHKWIEREKKEKLTEIQSDIGYYYQEKVKTGFTSRTEHYFGDLIILLHYEERVRKYPAWPFDSEILSKLLLVLFGPVGVNIIVKLILPT